MREQLTSRPVKFIYNPMKVTVGVAAAAIVPSSIPNGASGAIICAVNQEIAIGFTSVATDTGVVLPAKANYDVNLLENLQKLNWVRTTATDGILSFQFYIE